MFYAQRMCYLFQYARKSLQSSAPATNLAVFTQEILVWYLCQESIKKCADSSIYELQTQAFHLYFIIKNVKNIRIKLCQRTTQPMHMLWFVFIIDLIINDFIQILCHIVHDFLVCWEQCLLYEELHEIICQYNSCYYNNYAVLGLRTACL